MRAGFPNAIPQIGERGPANEAQARELVPLLREEGADGVLEAWREARDRAERADARLTARTVRDVVQKRSGRDETNRPAHTCLMHTCADCGATWAELRK